MATLFARIRRPSLRQGLMFGLILGLIQVVYSYVADFISSADILSFLTTVSLALFLLFGFLAGRPAARETGKLGTGVLAGIWTGVIGSLIIGLVSLGGTLLSMSDVITSYQQAIRSKPQNYPGLAPADITETYILTAVVANLLVFLLFWTLLTLVGGTLGGFLGRRRGLMEAQSAEAGTEGAATSDDVSVERATR